jgi:Zn-dependent protease with chaperone function
VRLDTANRSFAGLFGAAVLVGMFAFCGAVACVLVGLVVSRIASDGLDAFTASGDAVWPALAFIAVVAAGIVLGVWSLREQIGESRKLSRRIGALEIAVPSELADAASRTGLRGRVKLLDSEERFSFAYGALTPRVVVSRGLFEAASPAELDAVLEHERYHVRNLDPLKVVFARALPPTFFYLPALSALNMRYVAGRELAADRRALRSCGQKPLAGALLKAVRGPHWPELQGAAAIGGPDLLDARIAQLESGSEPRLGGLTSSAVFLSLAGGALLTGLFVASIVGFGGPSAVADATGASFTPLDIAAGALCAVPWAVGAWLGFRWLGRRTRRTLDPTSQEVRR